jgi:hypothetical protein
MALLLAGGVALVLAAVALDDTNIAPRYIQAGDGYDSNLQVERQAEFGIFPSTVQMYLADGNNGAIAPRFDTIAGIQNVAAVALEYARAYGKSVQRKYNEAFTSLKNPLLGTASRFKPVFMYMHSSANSGDYANYPYAHFQVDNTKPDIRDDQTIHKDPFPTGYGGPHFDRYYDSVGSESLRSPWSLSGALFRAVQTYREPRITQRPALGNDTAAPLNVPVRLANQQRRVHFMDRAREMSVAKPGYY